MHIDSWETQSRKVLLDRAPWLVVEEHEVKSPSGAMISGWTWVVLRDYVNIVAVTPEGQFVLLRQAKYAVRTKSLAVAGGYIDVDRNEEPLNAAKRELAEETGYHSNHWVSLAHYAIDANRGCGVGFLFLALDVFQVGDPTERDAAGDELVLMSQDDVRAALLKGEFRVCSWVNAVSMALLWLDTPHR